MGLLPQAMVLPAYGQSTIGEILPSIAAHLGCATDNVLGLPAADRYVMLLIDGLGDQVLVDAAAHAPFLAGLRDSGQVLTAGVPSTTVTSLTSLGTGLAPGRHGMAGFRCRVPETGKVFSPLTWDTTIPPVQFQSEPTWFELVRQNSVAVSVASVAPARFRGSGLTEAALRGPDFVAVDEDVAVADRVARIVAAALAEARSLVYVYERHLDHVGHVSGVSSREWRTQLEEIDRFVALLRAELPAEVRLVITGDHGMLDVPGRNFLIMEDEPGLLADVITHAGEARLRHFYTRYPREVAARWADRMGDHAWVRVLDDAIDEGWFGPMEDRVRGRFGDVLVAMRSDWGVLTKTMSGEFDLIGMHGSLTPVEMHVPLLVV